MSSPEDGWQWTTWQNNCAQWTDTTKKQTVVASVKVLFRNSIEETWKWQQKSVKTSDVFNSKPTNSQKLCSCRSLAVSIFRGWRWRQYDNNLRENLKFHLVLYVVLYGCEKSADVSGPERVKQTNKQTKEQFRAGLLQWQELGQLCECWWYTCGEGCRKTPLWKTE